MKFKLPSKKHMLHGVAALAFALLCTVLCTNIVFTKNLLNRMDTHTEDELQLVYASATDHISGEAMYRLYECGGKIGIYDAKTEILIDIIDVFVSTLPKGDRQSLKKGIDVFAFSDLVQIINDFTT